MPDETAPLLETRTLSRHFRIGGLFSSARLHAVDDLDLVIRPREILAVVGGERQRQEHHRAAAGQGL